MITRGSVMRPLAALVVLLALVTPAQAATFAVKRGGETRVVFVSKAPTETFEGRTDRMDGTLVLDPAALGDSLTVRLEVEMAGLSTGSRLRDHHMHERHLETAKYPTAVFEGATVLSPTGASLVPGRTTALRLAGTFTLHGVRRRLVCDAQATLTRDAAGERIAFVVTFPVTLADHAISRPEMLFLKLAETQQVRVSAIASSSRP